MAELELQSVSLAFGGLKVLDGVSFSARQGEILALIGPNGAGKTSVLNCICGLYHPSAGEIRFHDHSILQNKPHQIAVHDGTRRRENAVNLYSGASQSWPPVRRL